MNFTTSEHPILVAPRPVRLPSAYHAIVSRTPVHDFVRLGDPNSLDDFKLALFSDASSDKDQPSPRSSPRSGLPSEALEEFLSILRPSFFPPSSPVLRTRRQGVSSLPSFVQERSFPVKGRSRIEIFSQGCDVLDEIELVRSQQPSRNTISHTPDSLIESDAFLDYDHDTFPFRWYKPSVLSSPISRNHTRNPFLRHACESPSLISPLSPAAIPLPLPTPEEMIEAAMQ